MFVFMFYVYVLYSSAELTEIWVIPCYFHS